MADPTPPPAQAQSFLIRGQYIKDISFESPRAPQSLMGAITARPTIDVSVDLKAATLPDNLYEMTLNLSARASAENTTLFLVDLSYAGIFQITSVPEDRLEQLMMIDCPFVLFPFARRVIADITRDGGFPPLMLDPIDFHSLYLQSRARAGA